MTSSNDYVPVIITRDVTEAEFYKALLVGNDIPAIVPDENTESIGFPRAITSGGGGVPVLVPADMKQQAEEVLKQQSNEPVDEAELEREALAAPAEDPAVLVDESDEEEDND